MSIMRSWVARGTAAAALVLALFPVYWIVLTAFRPREEIFTSPARLLPGALSLDNLRTVHIRQAKIENDSAVILCIAPEPCLLAVAYRLHDVARGLKHTLDI